MKKNSKNSSKKKDWSPDFYCYDWDNDDIGCKQQCEFCKNLKNGKG